MNIFPFVTHLIQDISFYICLNLHFNIDPEKLELILFFVFVINFKSIS